MKCKSCLWKLTNRLTDLKSRESRDIVLDHINLVQALILCFDILIKGSTSLGAVNFFLMVKITEVPTLSIVLNLLYRMQQKFRRSTVKKGRITLERNWLIDHGLTISTMGLRSRVIRPFLTVDRRNFCCIR